MDNGGILQAVDTEHSYVDLNANEFRISATLGKSDVSSWSNRTVD